MPLPPSERLKFFVYLLESPSALDLYRGDDEGVLLGKLLKLSGIDYVARTVATRELFVQAVDVGLNDVQAQFPGRRPILHLSCHGNVDGLGFTDGSFIRWRELAAVFRPINRRVPGGLILSMSSCEGYAGICMAMEVGVEKEPPFYALVGSGGTPTWPETAVAYTTFYHQLVLGEHVKVCVERMCMASSHSEFFVQWGDKVKRSYEESLTNKLASLQKPEAAPA